MLRRSEVEVVFAECDRCGPYWWRALPGVPDDPVFDDTDQAETELCEHFGWLITPAQALCVRCVDLVAAEQMFTEPGTDVVHAVPAEPHQVDDDRWIPTILRYRSMSPWEVEMLFVDGEQVIPWSVARDVLTYGLDAPAGRGDIIIAPSSVAGETLLGLASPMGQLVLTVPTSTLREFVAATERRVPIGSEPAPEWEWTE